MARWRRRGGGGAWAKAAQRCTRRAEVLRACGRARVWGGGGEEETQRCRCVAEGYRRVQRRCSGGAAAVQRRCSGGAAAVQRRCRGGAEVQGRSARTDEAYSMRRTATEPRSRVTTAATRQLTHAAHACEALRRIQCAKTRCTAARTAESAAACARHVESTCSHARAAGLVSSRAQPRARPATAAAAAHVLQPRAMRPESMPRVAGASAARRAALACACACHRQSGWESRAHRRSQACKAQGAGCRVQGAGCMA